jgi:peptidoglycan/LPS O-acetylase OafA/YrhL
LLDLNTVLPQKNLVSIDIARAIAALGVFYYHLQMGSLLSRYTGIKILELTDYFGYAYAVPLFFLISGYCIHLANIKHLKKSAVLPLKEYYRRRFLRIYPAYFLALIISIAIEAATHYSPPVSKDDVLVHLFMLQGFSVAHFNGINIVLWTVAIEFAFYIVYPVFYALRLKLSLTKAMLFAGVTSVISITFFSIPNHINLVERYFFLNLWFAWCCGAWLADKYSFNKADLKKPLYKAAYALILAAFIALMFVTYPHFIIIKYQVNILVWAAPLILLLDAEAWLAKHKSGFLKPLIAIGLSSYSLYLFHEPFISLKNFLVHRYIPAALQPAGVIIGIVLIPAITWLTYICFEKPFISAIRKTA